MTGASSGIGKAISERLISDGHIVYGAARRLEKMQSLVEKGGHAIRLDITDEAQVAAAIDRIMSEQGRIDGLVNNAGYAVYGAVEDVSVAEARQQFEVNLFGLASLTQKVLPIMRTQSRGHIINISSIGGKVYTPLGAWYHATKHALEGWSDVLRIETAQFGIKVVIVEPGAIETEFTDVMNEPMLERSAGGAYEDLAQAMVDTMAESYDGSASTKPDVIAKVVSKAIKARNPKTRYAAGKLARTILFARRWLSDKAFDRMIMSMFK